METPEGMARRSVAIMLVVPSHRETRPVISTTLLPNCLPFRTKRSCHTIIWTSLVSSSMVTNTVPSLPLGCCRATGPASNLDPLAVLHPLHFRRGGNVGVQAGSDELQRRALVDAHAFGQEVRHRRATVGAVNDDEGASLWVRETALLHQSPEVGDEYAGESDAFSQQMFRPYVR